MILVGLCRLLLLRPGCLCCGRWPLLGCAWPLFLALGFWVFGACDSFLLRGGFILRFLGVIGGKGGIWDRWAFVVPTLSVERMGHTVHVGILGRTGFVGILGGTWLWRLRYCGFCGSHPFCGKDGAPVQVVILGRTGYVVIEVFNSHCGNWARLLLLGPPSIDGGGVTIFGLCLQVLFGITGLEGCTLLLSVVTGGGLCWRSRRGMRFFCGNWSWCGSCTGCGWWGMW